MKFRIFPYLIVFSAIIAVMASCSGRKSKAERKDLIPEKELAPILTDIYITEGLLAIPRVSSNFIIPDSIEAFSKVIEKHGYTQDMMNRTMRYYFIKRPKKLIKIYDNVLGRLSEMESRLVKSSPYLAESATNLWKGKSFYTSPGLSGNDTAWFDLDAGYSRIYTLKFTITIFPDDQTISPKNAIFIQTLDTARSKKRVYFPESLFFKDGRPHNYRGSVTITEPPPYRIKGWFLNPENQNPYAGRYYIIENIILTPDKLKE